MSTSVQQLQTAFATPVSADKTAEQTKRMHHLMKTVAENSPTAMETLQEASLRGCKYKFSDELTGCYGTFKREDKTIYLNEKHSDAVLATTLVHEARHAVQHHLRLCPDRNIASLLTMWRGSEADAMAFECAAAYEMQDNNPQAWFEFKKDHKGIAVAYSKEIKNSKEDKKALSEAFKAWYDDAPYVKQYDKDTVEFLDEMKEKAGWSFLKDNILGEQVGFNLCRKGKDLYVPDVIFLSSQRALTVDDEIAQKCQHVADEALFLYGRKDRSLDRLFVRQEDGSVRSFAQLKTAVPQEKALDMERSANQAIGEALPPWMQFNKKSKGRG